MYEHDPEKDQVTVNKLEHIQTTDTGKINNARIAAFTPEEQKKIIRRIDIRLVGTLGCMYCVSLMDRSNLSFANVAGMNVDLKLAIGSRYSIITLVFFLTYVILQPVATVILRRVGPQLFLPSITFFWGCVVIGMAFVHDWTQMVPLRLILGIFEAGFFPGCAYLLSCWYTRYEVQKRNAVFWIFGSVASAFAGIFAYGVSQLHGRGGGSGLGQHHGPTKADPHARVYQEGGIAGWRWILIFEGLVTCLVATVAFFTIVDFPEYAWQKKGITLRFITKEESEFMVARIEKDRHDAMLEEFRLKTYLSHALDLKVWGFAALFGLTTVLTYTLSFFLPIILQTGMGFDLALSQILVAPPYVAAAFYTFGLAWWADKHHLRSPCIILNGVLAIIGATLMGYVKNVGARYFGVFLVTCAANGNVPAVLTWQANNIRSQWKRAFCSASLVGAGGIGGIIGSTVFRPKDAPHYHPGMDTVLLAGCLMIAIALLLDFKFTRANKRAANGGKVIEGLPGFRYTL
ncbi:MFS general substrate transporter [Myriangium duriaei CBS 260.36]|uniref:MFS general substrate transporter n=1 Tax=Myriangium duriaei CBS 260.36 TaxID=1168546 RepID=A0A9P4J3I8_9PEZI|nr:MFS general substrate transporter [Myriangium duriaei CBS 260.36]